MLGVLGGILLVAGLVCLFMAVVRPHTVSLVCKRGAACTLEKKSVLRTSSTEVPGLRSAEAEHARRGARNNVRLVLRAEKDVTMGPWIFRGDSHVQSYEAAARRIQAFLADPSSPNLETTVKVAQNAVFWMAAAGLILSGAAMLLGYLNPPRPR